MADERTLYAGDLTSDQIHKMVRVKVNSTTTIEDKLATVRHSRSGESTMTTLWFASTRNVPGLLSPDNGFTVGHTELVQVLS